MTAPDDSHPMSRLLIVSATVVFMLWVISQAQSVLASFLVSVFLAILATPAVLWLGRRRVPVVAAVAIVVAVMVLILLVIGVVVGTSINSFSVALPQYQERIQEHVSAIIALFQGKGIAVPDDILRKYVNPGAVMSLTASLSMRLGSALSDIVLIVLTATFILLEATSFPIKLRAVLGDPNQVFPQFTRFVNGMKRYMVIKTVISLATGALVTVWLSCLGVDFPFLWGFVAFLLNYVPSLGSTVAGIPAVLLAFIQLGLGRAALAALGYIVINLVLDYGVETRLMGRRLGLSTLVVFVSLILWGSLLGPIGAILCIPLTMTLKFAFESQASTRWLAVLLGPENLVEKRPPAVSAPGEDATAA